MTYHNRTLTTPYYINHFDSAFWRLVAYDTALRVGERCNHRGTYWNMRVKCYNDKQRFYCFVSCEKCDKVFHGTEKVVRDMIGYFGF